MADSLASVLTEVIPFGLVVALSPLSIIPAVMMFHTPKPRPTSIGYLSGWLFGLIALTVIFYRVADLIPGVGAHPAWASYVRLVIGAVLVGFGLYKWFTRSHDEHTPAWMTKLGTVTPARAAGIAAALTAVNPKVLFMTIAAGALISTAGLTGTDAWTGGLWFVLVSASTVIVPVLAYAVMGAKLDGPMLALKEWMERQHAALVAGILVVIGVMVLYKGIHGL